MKAPEVDRALLANAQAGDAFAMNILLERLDPYVQHICRGIAFADGPDAAQMTLLAIFKSLRRLRDAAALPAWVTTIATREAVRAARRRLPSSPGDSLEDCPSTARPEVAVEVKAVLAQLSPEHRAVLVLREISDFDEAQIADMLAVAPGTVKSRLFRAKAAFRNAWAAD